MDHRDDLPAFIGLTHGEGGSPAFKFCSVFLEPDSQAAGHGGVIVQHLDAGFVPLGMPKIGGLQSLKPGRPELFNLGCRREHKNVVANDEHAGQMKIRDDSFQIKIAEVPKIFDE